MLDASILESAQTKDPRENDAMIVLMRPNEVDSLKSHIQAGDGNVLFQTAEAKLKIVA